MVTVKRGRTVEVAGVLIVLELRHELGLLTQQAVPADAVVEHVLLHLVSAAAAESLHRVVLQQQRDELSGVLRRSQLLLRPLHAFR